MAKSFFPQYFRQAEVCVACECEASIYETRVRLQKTRTGSDFFKRIFGAENSADADNR
jgi:hypothetical protein